MAQNKIYFNGKIVASEQATISILDRGFLYGDGLFESLRTQQQVPFQLDAHIKRLLRGLKLLKIRAPLSANQFKLAVKKTLAANKFKETYIKIIVTRGQASSHGLDPSNTASRPNVIIYVAEQKPYTQRLYQTGWKAIISSVVKNNNPSARLKSLCYLDNILAKLEAKKVGANEAFLLDNKGNLAEGTSSNIFIVKHGTLYTPTLESPILAGTTRALAIKLAKQAAIPIIKKTLSPRELYTADECFITLSGPGIVPITKIWHKRLSQGKCGSLTSSLLILYNAEIKKRGST